MNDRLKLVKEVVQNFITKLTQSITTYVILALCVILTLAYLFKDSAWDKAKLYQLEDRANKGVDRILDAIYYRNNKDNSSLDSDFKVSYKESISVDSLEPIESDYLSDGDIDGINANEVIKLQSFLRYQGYDIRADGIFRRETKLALKAFQQQHNLKSDGIFAGETRRLINAFIRNRIDR